MTQTLIGFDYTGTACVKISRDDLDPVTTPDDLAGAFLFNSKDIIQTQISRVDITSDSDPTALPIGADTTNFLRYKSVYDNKWTMYNYKWDFFPNLDFAIPLTDFVPKSRSTGWYRKGRQHAYDYSGEQQNTSVANVRMFFPGGQLGEPGWKLNFRTNVADWGGAAPATPFDRMLNMVNMRTNNGVTEYIPDTYSDVFVWNLPGDNTPLPTPAPNNPNIDKIRIDQGLRIAKPGFDVNTATYPQLVLSSEKRSTKILAADDIAIPLGMSEYLLDFPIPLNSICDIQFYTGSEIIYPALPRISPVGADWRLLTDRIQFNNTIVECRARFIVIINEDGLPPTQGNNNVLRQFVDSKGQDVVQFLRPGASDNPSFTDIIVDSRWPTLRILKEGYFTVSTGAQINNIPVQTEGYYPFIKMMVTTGGKSRSVFGGGINCSYTGCVRPATVGMAKLDGNNWFSTGETTYVRVSDNNLAFYTFRGAPKMYFWQYSNSGGWRLDTTMPDEVLGIRYYLFGIPKKNTP